jgi:hypothetical protein
MKRLLQSKKRGSAIALAMVVVMILLAMGTGLLSLGLHGRIISIRTSSGITARCAADAGLTKALYEMNEKLKIRPWDGSTLPQAINASLPNCDSVFSYSVTGDPASGYVITSVGTGGQAQQTVSATLELDGPFDYGIFGAETIELKNNSVIDWYNFIDGEESLKIGIDAIGNDAITLHNGCFINGDVAVGVGGDPADVIKLDVGASFTGESYALSEGQELPSITVPQWVQSLPLQGDITGPASITSSGKYSSIDLKNSEIITIDDSVTLYITDDIGLDQLGQLQISSTNPDASLTLYLGGNFITNNGGFINNSTNDPKKLKIYCLDSCSKVEFKTDCDLYGAIYGPNTDIIMRNSVNIHGAVVGKTFVQSATATFYYDASLREGNVNDEGVHFVVKRWHE